MASPASNGVAPGGTDRLATPTSSKRTRTERTTRSTGPGPSRTDLAEASIEGEAAGPSHSHEAEQPPKFIYPIQRFPSPDEDEDDEKRAGPSSKKRKTRATSPSPHPDRIVPGEYIYPDDIPADEVADSEWFGSLRTGFIEERDDLRTELKELKEESKELLYETTILQEELLREIKATKEAMEQLENVVDPEWMEAVVQLAEDAVETGEIEQIDDFLPDPEDEENGDDEQESGSDEKGDGDDDDGDDGGDDSAPAGEAEKEGEVDDDELDGEQRSDNGEEGPASGDEANRENDRAREIALATHRRESIFNDFRKMLKRQHCEDNDLDDERAVELSISIPRSKKRRLSGSSDRAQYADSESSASGEESPTVESEASATLVPPVGTVVHQETSSTTAGPSQLAIQAPSPHMGMVVRRRRTAPLKRTFERAMWTHTGGIVVVDMADY